MRDPEQEKLAYAKSLSKLISLKTISNTNKEEFDKLHAEIKIMFPKLFEVGTYHEFKKGLFVLVKGKDSTKKPIMFLNHHDVVEASGKWTHDPFGGEMVGDILYGRGTIDTKTGFYTMFQAMEELLEEGITPEQDVYLFSSMDEEDGGTGVREMRDYALENDIHFRFILDEGGLVIDNPVGGTGKYAMVACGEKSVLEVKYTANGNGGHSGAPNKNTPLVRLSNFVIDLENTCLFKMKVTSVLAQTFKCFSKNAKGITKVVFSQPHLFKPLLKVVAKSNPQLRSMLRTTTAFTMMKGSEQANVIPSTASGVINVRIAPFNSVQYVYKVLDKYIKKYDLEKETITIPVESSVSTYKTKEFAKINKVLHSIYPGVVVTPYVSNTASDSRFLRGVGDYIYGIVPVEASPEQVSSIHANDESIDIKNLSKAVTFYKEMMKA